MSITSPASIASLNLRAARSSDVSMPVITTSFCSSAAGAFTIGTATTGRNSPSTDTSLLEALPRFLSALTPWKALVDNSLNKSKVLVNPFSPSHQNRLDAPTKIYIRISPFSFVNPFSLISTISRFRVFEIFSNARAWTYPFPFPFLILLNASSNTLLALAISTFDVSDPFLTNANASGWLILLRSFPLIL